MRTKLVSLLATLLVAASAFVALHSAPAHGAAKVEHDLRISTVDEIGETSVFFVKGKVTTFTNRKVLLQRKVGKAGYELYKKVVTNDKGRFSTRFDGPTGSCFRVVVPGTDTYKRTVGKVGCLVSRALLPVGAAKVRHELTVSSEEVGGEGTNDFRLFGMVPTYKGRDLRIQARVNGGGWRLWKTSPTDPEDGAFSEPVYGGKRGSTVCYKVVVPATKKYKATKRKAGCITTVS